LTTFTASDGENLAVQDWPTDGPAWAQVLLVHGLGEYAGRYDALAQRLSAWGCAVRGYDQYGHGESGGPRGGLNHPQRLMDDLADLIDATRARMSPHQCLILLGHSMGALVAGSVVAQGLRAVDALVLSSPALDLGLSPWQRCQLACLGRLAPNLRVGNGLHPEDLSHDATVVLQYQKDRRCHDRISARLARFMVDAGANILAQAPQWETPTLLLYAGSDRIVNPAGSRRFAQTAPAAVVQAHGFEPLYHEIFNESEELAEPVLEQLERWLAHIFAARRAQMRHREAVAA